MPPALNTTPVGPRLETESAKFRLFDGELPLSIEESYLMKVKYWSAVMLKVKLSAMCPPFRRYKFESCWHQIIFSNWKYIREDWVFWSIFTLFLKFEPLPASFLLFLSFQYSLNQLLLKIGKMPMTRFEPRISGEGSDRSTNCATTTAPNQLLLHILRDHCILGQTFNKSSPHFWCIW